MLTLRYLRAVAAMYIRMTFKSFDVYELLEPLLNDYRKLRWRDMCEYKRGSALTRSGRVFVVAHG